MPVKVQLDQSARNSSAASTSGLLLGTHAPHFRILHLLPTPTRPSGVSPRRWAVEHANLVQPMCPGGLTILGSYLPLRGTSASPLNHRDAAAAIARDVAAIRRTEHTSILLCRTVKGRVVAKLVSPNSAESLKNAEFKEIPHLTDSIVSIRATLPIPSATFPSFSPSESPNRFKSAFEKLAHNLASHLILQLPNEQNTITTNTKDTRILAETMQWPPTSSESNHTLRIHLLAPVCPPFEQSHTATTPPSSHPPAFSRLHGSLHLEAVAPVDATTGHVLSALRLDLTRSIRARIDLIIESYAPDDNEDTDEKLSLPNHSFFPVRVVASNNSPSLRCLSLSEYLMPGETINGDVTSRFAEIFSWDEDMIAAYKVEMKEDQHPEPSEDEIKPRVISSASGSLSPPEISDNEIDIQNVMQVSLIIAIALGFAAILTKQLLYFW